MYRTAARFQSAFTLIELLVVSAVMLLIFGGLFSSFQYTLRLIGESRAKMTALALITDRLEYVRSLPYDDVGTILGIPSGAIPQYRVISLNDLELHERVLIEYVDDDADGTGGADSNGVLTDYKRIKIEYQWNTSGSTSSLSIASTIVPRSIETNAGGGTIRVNVFDATVQPLSGINVRLYNSSSTSPVDVTRQTDATGAALFTGAPAGSGYEIFVSEPGYSSDQTYVATTSLPAPTTLPVAVLEADVTTMNFQIDRLATTTIRFVENQVFGDITDSFADLSGLATSTAVVASGGELMLADIAGVYEVSGDAWLLPVTPSPLAQWGYLKHESANMAQTEVRVQFYTSTSTSTSDIVPDSVLPGNSAGFTDAVISLRGIDVSTYPTLVPRLILSTGNTSVTPRIESVTLGYLESEDELPGVDFTLTSDKTIGTDLVPAPVHKYVVSTTTDSNGERFFGGMEWGGYQIDPDGYTVISACEGDPIELEPATEKIDSLALELSSAHSLRVQVTNTSGEPLIGASVILRQGATTHSEVTDWCGYAYLPALVSASDSELEVSAPNYTTNIINPFSVSGETVQNVILN